MFIRLPINLYGVVVIVSMVLRMVVVAAIVFVLLSMLISALPTNIGKLESAGYIVLSADETNEILAAISDLECNGYWQQSFNPERWFGKADDQSGDSWGELDGLTPYRAYSGDNDFGLPIKVLGTEDLHCCCVDATEYDVRALLPIAVSSQDSVYAVRVLYGDTDPYVSLADGCYTTFYFSLYSIRPALSSYYLSPIDVHTTIIRCSVDKVWVQVKNTDEDEYVDFFVAVHEYIGGT